MATIVKIHAGTRWHQAQSSMAVLRELHQTFTDRLESTSPEVRSLVQIVADRLTIAESLVKERRWAEANEVLCDAAKTITRAHLETTRAAFIAISDALAPLYTSSEDVLEIRRWAEAVNATFASADALIGEGKIVDAERNIASCIVALDNVRKMATSARG